jgi:malonyl-CoA O-methyltransferase
MTSAAAIAASFGRAARGYTDQARVQRAMAEWVAEWLPPQDARNGRALECGAGTGILTEKLLPWKGALLATDLSSGMCEEGARRLRTVNWQQAAAEFPPPGPWNWIFTSSMLQWVHEPRAIFAAWRQALAPGGRIVGGMFVAPTIAEWTALLPEAAQLEFRSPEQWVAALQSAGLHPVRQQARGFDFEFPSAFEFLRSLHAVGAAPARRAAPGRLRAVLREYEGRNKVDRAGPDAPCSFVRSSWTFFRFEATA